MPNDFPYIEAKRGASRLSLADLSSALRAALPKILTGAIVENEFLRGYPLPQSVLHGNPERPWDLAPQSITRLKNALLSLSDSVSLDSTMEILQGVTPGGEALGIFLTRSSQLAENALQVPACEAEDVTSWRLGQTGKWLIYPYAPDGSVLDLGHLELDLSEEKAEERIEHLIATGKVEYPKAARFLVQHYNRLASREAEKRGWKEYGKRWYEYHRPRDSKRMRLSPKIVTRRMTKNAEFALDEKGVVPTDGCFALSLKESSTWRDAMRSSGFTDRDSLLFLLGLLNSNIFKVLLRSTADTWQGGFYQVREDLLSQIPVLIPSEKNRRRFRLIVDVVGEVANGRGNPDQVNGEIFRLYGQARNRQSIVRFLSSR